MLPHGLLRSTVAALVAAGAAVAHAADLPPDVVARFTRQVQPLIVNRCAAGACHGGPAGHAPKFDRGPATGRPDRTITLANLDVFLKAVGPDRDPKRLVALLAARHPTVATKGGFAAAPLTASERITLETWLAAVRATESGRIHDPAVQQAAAHAPVAPSQERNRFRDLIETASNPPEFPPPPEPQGVIFKRDDGVAPEPPEIPPATAPSR
jgi:hypothetical protein